ncbi:aromatic ring-hydroxylating dioxygenase subunit alpha [Micromonospora sp. HUAS LYJ1]|uniref:aromatic ring-hydroxylating oxygenase subunit alpha n=1 Tax=Micromonospora sp. HUAS LYJ1 TaxID=3061626 RepID=UPI0026727B6B|nr:aromatic ring-hydroxylating dioxygenase subunit alpha [Micromonospora sp. HUAS LYJ1]WKU03530.1 aromatic ring-hydroxylating dioxygenase subunit alpha [Micromonospora sp. HUAS LYJ1]
MRRERQLEILDRIVGHRVGGNTTDMYPDMYFSPTDAYKSPERYQEELDRIFRRTPLLVCLSGDVAEPGDFVTLDMMGVPLLVARGEDGKVRAFRNTCQHRGACVAQGRGKGKRAFSCPYHAWSYRLDGSLIRPTHLDGFRGLDIDEVGLPAVPCDEAAGLVFVSFAGREQPEFDARAWLGGSLVDDFESFGYENYQLITTRSTTRDVNWKIMFDSFCEMYHVQFLHAKTIAHLFRSDCSTFDDLGLHGLMTGVRATIDELKAQPREEWELMRHAALNYHIAPNTVLIHMIDHVEMYRILPEGPTRCRAELSLYAPELPTTERAERHWARQAETLINTIETEDMAMADQAQFAVDAGNPPVFRFGRNEPALIHHHEVVEALLAGEEERFAARDPKPVRISAGR